MSDGTSFLAVWFCSAQATPLTRRLLVYFASGAYKRKRARSAVSTKWCVPPITRSMWVNY